jgi:hypothetical protein
MPSVDPESRELEYLSISKRDIDSCAFEAWYDRFKHVTFKSKIVELDQDFVDYLNAEGIYLPEDG